MRFVCVVCLLVADALWFFAVSAGYGVRLEHGKGSGVEPIAIAATIAAGRGGALR